jgi:nucleoid DNA-binding protein
MSKDAIDGYALSMPELIKKIMDEPLEGKKPSRDHVKTTEAQLTFVEELFERVLGEVKKGNSVRVKNFGHFELRTTKPTARNPSTNEVRPVKQPNRLKFVSSAKTQDTLN